MRQITDIRVRMYKMGTGDCFVLFFEAENECTFKMMIDCGTCQGTYEDMAPVIEKLLGDVSNSIDLLIVTHEHKDHVHGFDVCKELITKKLNVKNVWLAWTENEESPLANKWKKDYGQKKKALAKAASRLKQAVATQAFEDMYKHEMNGEPLMIKKREMVEKIMEFADLHMDKGVDYEYKGGLAGMNVVKEIIGAPNKISYPEPGSIRGNIRGLDGVKIYIMGPSTSWEQIRKKSVKEGSHYTRNYMDVAEWRGFSEALLSDRNSTSPFDESYVVSEDDLLSRYQQESEWRKIDHDWLYGAGELGLRVNTVTNNLSLAIAIEFGEENDRKVLLFPGDTEYGGWAAWHDLKWDTEEKNGQKHLTEELLNRTVFYKVSHHLSYNGTPRALGLEMMNHRDLVTMCTLDYNKIGPGWSRTMPSYDLLSELLIKSRGRLLIMNDENIFANDENTMLLKPHIEATKKKRMTKQEFYEFRNACREEEFFIEYKVSAKKK